MYTYCMLWDKINSFLFINIDFYLGIVKFIGLYIFFYVQGKWYIYCTTEWEDKMGTALCKELSYGDMYFSAPKFPDKQVSFVRFNNVVATL